MFTGVGGWDNRMNEEGGDGRWRDRRRIKREARRTGHCSKAWREDGAQEKRWEGELQRRGEGELQRVQEVWE